MTVQTRVDSLFTILRGRMRSIPPLCVLLMLSAGTPAHSQLGPPMPASFSGPILANCNGGVYQPQVLETSPSVLTIQFTASPSLGSSVQVQILVDGAAVGPPALLTPGQSIIPITTVVLGGLVHNITFQPTFQTCNFVGVFVLGSAIITPQAASVPALSLWGILLLAVSLTVLSARMMRSIRA